MKKIVLIVITILIITVAVIGVVYFTRQKVTHGFVEKYVFKDTISGDSILIGRYTTGKWAKTAIRDIRDEMILRGFKPIPYMDDGHSLWHKTIILGLDYGRAIGKGDQEGPEYVSIIINETDRNNLRGTGQYFMVMPGKIFYPQYAVIYLL